MGPRHKTMSTPNDSNEAPMQSVVQPDITANVPFGLGNLFAGSEGMKCELCDKRVWWVWLSDDEKALLKDDGRDQLRVCEQKLGKVRCSEHRPV